MCCSDEWRGWVCNKSPESEKFRPVYFYLFGRNRTGIVQIVLTILGKVSMFRAEQATFQTNNENKSRFPKYFGVKGLKTNLLYITYIYIGM